MTEKEKTILNEFLSKTLKIDDEQIAGLYNEAGELEGLQVAYDADALRIKQQGTERDNQFKRGQKKAAEELEKTLRSKYEIESDLQGVELVDAIVLSKVEETAKGSEKDISKHPKMIEARLEWEKEQKKRDREWEDKIKAKDTEFAVMKVKDKVKSRAMSLLDEFKVIHHENPARKQAMMDIYLNEILTKNYVEDERGEPLAIGDDGTPLKNAHGYTISLKEHAKEIADKYFDYQQADSRSSPGNKPPSGNGSGDWIAPKTDEEYEERIKAATDPAERIRLVEYFNNK